MANVIKHKRGSGSDPVASDLVVGEVAIRTDTGKLFTKMDNGSVAEIAGGGSDIAINTLSSSSGTGGGSATFNGSAYRFTLSAPPSVSAQQLLVSINGVIQKPVAGTGQPSEGFSVDGTDIILGDAPATGSDFFILTFKSLGVSEPADNSVTSAKIVDGAIVNADINASAAIAGTKISPDFGSQNITTTGQVFSSYATLTAVNPTLTFNDSDNNPDYTINVNSGVLKITDSTNTADRLVISSSGNVGIGTTSPSDNLEVASAGHTGILIQSNRTSATDNIGAVDFRSSSTDVARIQSLVDGTIKFRNTSSLTERMRIDSSGRVLIGTTNTTPAASNVAGIVFGDNTAGTATAGIASFCADGAAPLLLTRRVSDGNVLGIADDTTTRGLLRVNSTDFEIRSNNNMRFQTGGGNERMRIDSSGNVGISTTSPSGKLDIQTGTNGNVLIDAEGGSVNHAKIVNDSGDLTLGARNTSADTKLTSQRHIHFLTGGSEAERMRIDSSGNVLIGMTSASTTTQGMMFRPGQESSIFRDSGFNLLVGGAQSGQRLIDFRHNGASIGHISKSGTTGISYNEGSDYRLKENAVAISDGITRLKTLKPYRFNFKADASTTVDGFFAHEVTAVPEAISGTKDEIDENNEPVYQGIDKSKLVPLLVAALQEAIGRIEVLEAK